MIPKPIVGAVDPDNLPRDKTRKCGWIFDWKSGIIFVLTSPELDNRSWDHGFIAEKMTETCWKKLMLNPMGKPMNYQELAATDNFWGGSFFSDGRTKFSSNLNDKKGARNAMKLRPTGNEGYSSTVNPKSGMTDAEAHARYAELEEKLRRKQRNYDAVDAEDDPRMHNAKEAPELQKRKVWRSLLQHKLIQISGSRNSGYRAQRCQ